MSKAVGATDVKLVISTSNHPTLWVVRAANVISLARQDYPRKHHPSVRASKASALARPSSRVSTLNNSNLRIILILTQCTLPGLKCDRCSLGTTASTQMTRKGVDLATVTHKGHLARVAIKPQVNVNAEKTFLDSVATPVSTTTTCCQPYRCDRDELKRSCF